MNDEAFYKTQAQEARKTAEQATNDEHRRAWLEIAEDYEALADSVRSFLTRWKPA